MAAARGYGNGRIAALSPFEIALIEKFSDTDVPSLPEEQVKLLEIHPLAKECTTIRFSIRLSIRIVCASAIEALARRTSIIPGCWPRSRPQCNRFGRAL